MMNDGFYYVYTYQDKRKDPRDCGESRHQRGPFSKADLERYFESLPAQHLKYYRVFEVSSKKVKHVNKVELS